MLFMLNNLSRCQNNREQGRRGRELLQICVCSKWNGKWDRLKCDRWQQQSSATLGHKTDFGNCLLLISYCLLPPQRSHFTSCTSPPLLHRRLRQVSSNCPQLWQNPCFTLKGVNTNNCFQIPAEWSVWPAVTQPVLMALSPVSAELSSCPSSQNSYLHTPNRLFSFMPCSRQASITDHNYT